MKAISIATEGYWDANALCIATNGYWCIDIIIDDGTKHTFLQIDSNNIDTLKLQKEELELIMILKTFLICH